ncbi:sterile alpha motif domain-containing protein 1-like [Dasypus novemcinctus]|uniref:sterile alpha motif domain-containing protein 1-like n=1 Tax=Dasypus novemcinctus TaxID=9361 RepID=UPI0039C9858C
MGHRNEQRKAQSRRGAPGAFTASAPPGAPRASPQEPRQAPGEPAPTPLHRAPAQGSQHHLSPRTTCGCYSEPRAPGAGHGQGGADSPAATCSPRRGWTSAAPHAPHATSPGSPHTPPPRAAPCTPPRPALPPSDTLKQQPSTQGTQQPDEGRRGAEKRTAAYPGFGQQLAPTLAITARPPAGASGIPAPAGASHQGPWGQLGSCRAPKACSLVPGRSPPGMGIQGTSGGKARLAGAEACPPHTTAPDMHTLATPEETANAAATASNLPAPRLPPPPFKHASAATTSREPALTAQGTGKSLQGPQCPCAPPPTAQGFPRSAMSTVTEVKTLEGKVRVSSSGSPGPLSSLAREGQAIGE